MAVVLSRPGNTTEYVLRADRESAQKTCFDIRVLTAEEVEELEDLAPMSEEQAIRLVVIMAAAHAEGRDPNDDEIARMNEVVPMDRAYMRRLHRQCQRAVRIGLAGIRGMLDRDGKPLEMSVEDFARCAPKPIIFEIGAEIQRRSRPAEDFIKN